MQQQIEYERHNEISYRHVLQSFKKQADIDEPYENEDKKDWSDKLEQMPHFSSQYAE